MDIRKLMELVAVSWKFGKKNYPRIPVESTEVRTEFALKHIHLHMSFEVGELAKILEAGDHASGLFISIEQGRHIARNFILNGLKLAEILGVTHEEIVAELLTGYLENKYKT